MSRESSGKPGVGRVISAVFVALLAVLPMDGAAQEQTEKLFVRFNGTERQIEALDGAANRFRSPILTALSVQFAGTAEMDEVFSQCREAMGVAPTEERECQMEAARRLSMDLVFEVEINELGRDHWELSLEVWDPHQNMLTADLFVEVEGESIERAARTGLAALASRYLCSTGVEAHCGDLESAGAQTGVPTVDNRPVRGRLEIIGVDPSPVAVFVDGVEVGTAPGQFLALPLGRVEVTLRAPGYEDQMRNVTLTEERMEVLRDLSLEPLPATLVVTCNVEGANVEVDGRSVGTTRGGDAVSFEVESGRRTVRASREGYIEQSERVELSPGGRTSLSFELEVYVEPASLAPEDFVLIPAGSFQMGSPSSEPGRDDDETQHRVRITRDFYLQAHEVTQGEWRSLMGNNPSNFSSCGSDCPVDRVNWYEAVAYANALSEREELEACYRVSGRSGAPGGLCSGGYDACEGEFLYASVSFVGLDCEGYRLPTEAEWEYAARAGTTTAWHCGARESCVDRIAWYSDNSSSRTHPVGEMRPNDWDLYDMSGNVFEWVWDWYESDYYTTSPARDPLGPVGGQTRVYRGGYWGVIARSDGSFYDGASRVRSANRRSNYGPGWKGNAHGFRLARTVPTASNVDLDNSGNLFDRGRE